MQRLRLICSTVAAMAMPVLLTVMFPSLVLGQIQEEPQPGEESRSYALQWGLVVLLTLVAYLALCKPAFREGKVQKEKKTKKDKGKGGH